MTAQTDDFEVGLSEASFLWLASADYAKRSSVYKALRSAIEDLSDKPWARSSARGMTWAIRNDKQSGFDVALMPTGGKSIYLLAIMIDGDLDRRAFETQLKRVRDARAELPKLASFHLNSVKSPTDFSELLDALTNLADSQIEPLLGPLRNRIVHASLNHEGPVEVLDLKALDEFTSSPLSHVWEISRSARRLEAVFYNSILAARSDTATHQVSAQAAEWEFPENAPSAAQDADYFFSRRATVAVPPLSCGRPPARPLIK